MAIRALPADTARLLGAASQLATPTSVVKELVENALDASATAIEVRISPNTVDKIEVRDDGHGILPADFAALGRRGHTSKLARFEDLGRVVSSGSLGFRGEGLASANSLGYVAITTRSRGGANTETTPAAPPVASSFRLVRGVGGVAPGSLKPTSAPVGTTVTVTCLFASLPVRRKAAEREASKTLAAIKALLCGYALARPQRLRLVLRVFQQPAPVWQFLPRVVADSSIMREAACVLFGPEAARQCQEVVLSLTGRPAAMGFQSASALADAPMPGTTYVFEGFLPRPGADLSKLAFGAFVSVDGRPLSTQHGSIATKLLTIFWTHLERTVSLAPGQQQQQRRFRDVFIRLNIQCPVGSYDANVEASKTDVLFSDEQAVCSAFEQYCSQVYGASAQESDHPRPSVQGRPQPFTPARATTTHGSPQSSLYASVQPAGRHLVTVPMQSPSGEAASVQDGPGEHPLTMMGQERERRAAPSPAVYFPSSPSPVARSGRGEGGVAYSYNGRSGIRRQQPDYSTLSHRPSVPARGLQTPPSSSPVESASQVGGDSRSGRGVLLHPGTVSQRAYRQTALSFRASLAGGPRQQQQQQQREAADPDVFCPTTPIQQQAQQTDDGRYGSPGSPESPGLLEPASAVAVQRSPRTTVARHTAGRETVAREERPNGVVLEVSLAKLAKAAGRFAATRETAWSRDTTDAPSLSLAGIGDDSDLAALEKRTKDAIAKWLARQTREAGRGTVKVAFYLRQGLEKRTLAGGAA